MKAKFGRYVFLKKLAVGGMAEIFLARRLSFGGFAKFVVLKRLLPEHRNKRAYEQLFLTEARYHAVLNHPNIVSLHDLGKLDDAYFMAMEYVHGVSGAELMARAAQRRKPLPLGCTLRIVASIADALHYGHATLDDLGESPMGILHHDVSPHNIQIGYDGAVKLLDYGVATRVNHPAPGGRRGKPAYMSPEAIEKRPLDHRSDLFSLGVVLYEMSLGRRLFKAATPKETMLRARAAQVRPPTEINSGYPAALESIVLKALSRDRADRYPDGHSLAVALRQVAEAQRLDTTQKAFSTYLAGLFAEEVARRAAELAALARASTEGRRRDPSGPLPRVQRPTADDTQRQRPEPEPEPPAPTAPAPTPEPAPEPAPDGAPAATADEPAAAAPDQRPADPAPPDEPSTPDDSDAEPADSDMATLVKSPEELGLNLDGPPPGAEGPAPTPEPVSGEYTPTPSPVPEVADVGDAELELEEPSSPTGSEPDFDAVDAVPLAELPPEANDAEQPDWDDTFAAPLAAARRRLVLVMVLGLLLAVGAFFAGQQLDLLGTRTGSLHVETQPAGAQVFRGSNAVGTTPITLDQLPIGTTLRLRVEKDGYQTVEDKITIFPDRRHRAWMVPLQRKK